MRVKAIIIDDEKHVREGLLLLAQWKHHGIHTILEAEDGEEAKKLIMEHKPEIIFTDMRMPKLDGISLLKWLHSSNIHCKTIVVSGYDDFEYMRNAIYYKSFDYLLKPIRQERLQTALKKLQLSAPSEPFITIKDRDTTHKILLNDIIFLQADQKYTEVHLANDCYLTSDSLKDLETRFEHIFIRLHRSILINRKQLCGIEKNQEQLFALLKDSPQKLEISRRHQASIRQYLKDQ